MKTIRIFLLAIFAMATTAGMAQQSAEELIQEALTNIKAKNYKEASNSLQFALNEVNRLMLGDVANSLPAEVNGFKMAKDDSDNSASSLGVMGSGLTVTRHYYKNGQQQEGDEPYFELSILGNSASISAVTMWLSNPMVMAASGAKAMKIGSRKAALKSEDDNISLQLPLTSSMITVTGYNFKSEAEFTAIINKLNFDQIIKALGE